jgi:hypothetical protein
MRRTPGLERSRRPPEAVPMPEFALGGDEQVVLRPEVNLCGATEFQPVVAHGDRRLVRVCQ